MKYEIKYEAAMDETTAKIFRDGKLICSMTWLGESPAELLKIAIAHAKERGL